MIHWPTFFANVKRKHEILDKLKQDGDVSAEERQELHELAVAIRPVEKHMKKRVKQAKAAHKIIRKEYYQSKN